eukprot:gene24614-10234_t
MASPFALRALGGKNFTDGIADETMVGERLERPKTCTFGKAVRKQGVTLPDYATQAALELGKHNRPPSPDKQASGNLGEGSNPEVEAQEAKPIIISPGDDVIEAIKAAMIRLHQPEGEEEDTSSFINPTRSFSRSKSLSRISVGSAAAAAVAVKM